MKKYNIPDQVSEEELIKEKEDALIKYLARILINIYYPEFRDDNLEGM